MADIFSKRKRSEVMSKIWSKGNASTELTLVRLFRERQITGWRRHQPLPGKPDFIFPKSRLAVFVDGCFWHGCPHCHTQPKTRRKFWSDKINSNRRRDRKVSRELRSMGWSVIRIWECRLRKHPEAQIRRVLRKLGKIDKL